MNPPRQGSSRSAPPRTPISSSTCAGARRQRARRLRSPRSASQDDDGRCQPRRRLPARAVALRSPRRRAAGPRRASTRNRRNRRLHDAGDPARRGALASGSAYDVIFDAARAAIAELDGVASVAEETSSWPYRHDLDLTGFIDGTENPTLVEAPEWCSSPTGSPGAGGTILLLQKWSHDAAAWESLGGRGAGARDRPAQEQTARSSTTSRPTPTSRAPTRTNSGRSSAGTCRTAPSPTTGRCSSASAPRSGRSRRCSRAWPA